MSDDVRFEVSITNARGRHATAVVALDGGRVALYVPPGAPVSIDAEDAEQLAAALMSTASVAKHRGRRGRR